MDCLVLKIMMGASSPHGLAVTPFGVIYVYYGAAWNLHRQGTSRIIVISIWRSRYPIAVPVARQRQWLCVISFRLPLHATTEQPESPLAFELNEPRFSA